MSLRRIAKPFRHKEDKSSYVRMIEEQEPRTSVETFRDDSSERSPTPEPIDDALAKGIEITEGGWICKVEQFEDVVSRGDPRYRHLRPHKKRSSSQEPNEAGPAKQVLQSIIIHYHHPTIRHETDVFDDRGRSVSQTSRFPENYLEIKSPLILDVLRAKATYDQEVCYMTIDFFGPQDRVCPTEKDCANFG